MVGSNISVTKGLRDSQSCKKSWDNNSSMVIVGKVGIERDQSENM